MQLKDEKVFWDWYNVQSEYNNGLSYGKAIFAYAWRWALMMEYLMEQGYELEEIADDMGYLADEEGITGFMHSCAAGTIAGCWVHGERFRQWFNLENQLGTEGEEANKKPNTILNLAMMGIG